MNFEGLETTRVLYINRAFEAMAKIMEDKTAPLEARLAAGKLIDSMSDTIVKAYLLSETTKSNESIQKRMADKLDKLDEIDK